MNSINIEMELEKMFDFNTSRVLWMESNLISTYDSGCVSEKVSGMINLFFKISK